MKHLQFIVTSLIFTMGLYIGVECLNKGQAALGAFLILGQIAPKLKLLEATLSQHISHDAAHVLLEQHDVH